MPDNVLAIIGHPIAHSLSPLMHNFAAKELGIPYTYVAFDIKKKNDVKAAVQGMRALGVQGFNVTVPHKIRVMEFLDHIDKEAKAIGAVNTVYKKGRKLYGTNTDGIGFLRALEKQGFNPRKKNVVIIGAGGSSRAIGVTLLRNRINNLTIINRSKNSGSQLVNTLSKLGNVNLIQKREISLSRNAISAADLVVQCTSLGMKPSDPLPIASPRFRKGQLVYDIIYTPSETRFLAAARKAGAKTMNGLAMLVYQGSASFRIWTGKKFPEEAALQLLVKHLGRR